LCERGKFINIIIKKSRESRYESTSCFDTCVELVSGVTHQDV